MFKHGFVKMDFDAPLVADSRHLDWSNSQMKESEQFPPEFPELEASDSSVVLRIDVRDFEATDLLEPDERYIEKVVVDGERGPLCLHTGGELYPQEHRWTDSSYANATKTRTGNDKKWLMMSSTEKKVWLHIVAKRNWRQRGLLPADHPEARDLSFLELPADGALSDGQVVSRESTTWRFTPADHTSRATQRTPRADSAPTEKILKDGDTFRVSQQIRGADGILYLRLEDGNGWFFESFPGIGVLCVLEEEEPERRLAADGCLYTKEEFLSFYGSCAEWEAAVGQKKLPPQRRRVATAPEQRRSMRQLSIMCGQ